MSWDLRLPAPPQRLRVQLVALSDRKVNEVNARRADGLQEDASRNNKQVWQAQRREQPSSALEA